MNYNKYGKLEVNPSKISESFTTKFSLGDKLNNTDLMKESYSETPKFLLPKIEAIHAGTTRNYNNYPAHKLQGNSDLKSGIYSFLKPYPKPVIYNHDTWTKATGRIETAVYSDVTECGRPGIIVIPKITDKEAIESILDKRLLTVSIGATVDGCTCNICGTDIVNEGYCGHMKGEEYEGKMCEWIAGNIFFDELSWVNVPADEDAMVVDTQSFLTIGESKNNDKSLSEKLGLPTTAKLTVVEYKQPIKEENKKMDEKEIIAMKEELALLKKENASLKEATSVDTKLEGETDDKTDEVQIKEDENKDKEIKDEATDETTIQKDATAPVIEVEKDPKKEEKEEKVVIEIENTENTVDLSILKENESLQKELKTLYINRVVEANDFATEEDKNTYVEKISKRTIESLKDMVEDLASAPKKVVTEKTTESRVTKKIENPLKAKTKEESTDVVEESVDSDFNTLMKLLKK